MKRIYLLSGILFILLCGLCVRIYGLMITEGEKYQKQAREQSEVQIKLGGGRGNIYDRNMQSFTSAGKKKTAIIVESENPESDFEACRVLDRADPYTLYNRLYKDGIVYQDVSWNFNENLLKNYKNACVIEDIKRYSDDGAGAAVIGYVSDGNGASGVEYAADAYLKNGDSWYYTIGKDASGKLLPGVSFEKEQNADGMLLKTTLDKNYVEICQTALGGQRGATVLLDVSSFDLLAMVSSPTFNRNAVAEYLNDGDKSLMNRATARYDMGSVFKIVVAATALENRTATEEDLFHCNGIKTIGDVNFLCENHKTLPNLTLFDAFLYSCNSVFIDIGQKTGYNNIIDMACAFGLNEQLIYPETFPQVAGVLPDKENYYLADVANLSIGQGKLMGTVVHGAYLSAVIATGGMRENINVLDALLDKDGTARVSLRTSDKRRVVSEETANTIAGMMLATVKEGTGKSAASPYVTCAGKTGSAQTGIQEEGEPCVHAWFTGFFPAENPKYALCVFVENGKSGGEAAAPIFREIAEKIAAMEGW